MSAKESLYWKVKKWCIPFHYKEYVTKTMVLNAVNNYHGFVWNILQSYINSVSSVVSTRRTKKMTYVEATSEHLATIIWIKNRWDRNSTCSGKTVSEENKEITLWWGIHFVTYEQFNNFLWSNENFQFPEDPRLQSTTRHFYKHMLICKQAVIYLHKYTEKYSIKTYQWIL